MRWARGCGYRICVRLWREVQGPCGSGALGCAHPPHACGAGPKSLASLATALRLRSPSVLVRPAAVGSAPSSGARESGRARFCAPPRGMLPLRNPLAKAGAFAAPFTLTLSPGGRGKVCGGEGRGRAVTAPSASPWRSARLPAGCRASSVSGTGPSNPPSPPCRRWPRSSRGRG